MKVKRKSDKKSCRERRKKEVFSKPRSRHSSIHGHTTLGHNTESERESKKRHQTKTNVHCHGIWIFVRISRFCSLYHCDVWCWEELIIILWVSHSRYNHHSTTQVVMIKNTKKIFYTYLKQNISPRCGFAIE